MFETDLSLEFLRVVEQAAIACAHTMGQGDRHKSDHVAVEAMRRVMDTVPIDGTIVIGEGERDEAPMLYIGEKVGMVHAKSISGPKPVRYAEVDIAVDPLEGTNLCATGAPNAIAVLAASERGGLLHAPDLYMEKIVVGPACKGAIDLDVDRKSTRLNSSHLGISYAVFCLKKKKWTEAAICLRSVYRQGDFFWMRTNREAHADPVCQHRH